MARALALRGLETTVVERCATIGQGISSRNSEVIHAGLYYASSPWKAKFCIAGKKSLYAYCEAKGVRHRRCGKLVVATDDSHIEQLERLGSHAAAAGVEVRMLSAQEASSLEPEVACIAALHSPSTGIIDSHSLLEALRADAESAGATLVFHTRVLEINEGQLLVDSAGERSIVNFDRVVNAAGLFAGGLTNRTTRFVKGNYFACRRRPFTRLVYPLPEPGGLGVHATVSLDGAVKFGPDVEELSADDPDNIDYVVDDARRARFERAIRAYWPGLRPDDLRPDYAGVRPKIPGGDFLIHRSPGSVVTSLLGIESPGLTAALAIADHVADLVCEV